MQEKYRISVEAKAKKENVVEYGNFRITLLTENLIRLEYCESKNFVDMPSQVIWNREFPQVEYKVCQEGDELKLETVNVVICGKNLGKTQTDVEIIRKGKHEEAESVWCIGKTPETWKGTARTLDEVDGETQLGDGLLGKRGIAVIDDSKSYLILENGELQKREVEGKDFYIFAYGLNYKQCLKDYFKLTGNTPLIPRFALGNWWSRYHRYDEEEYLALMDEFEKRKIPLSVAMVDMDWHLTNIDAKYGSGWTGYTWNKELFPDPEHFMQELHKRLLKVSLNVHPAEGVRAFEEPYEKMVDEVGELLHVNKEKEEPITFDVTTPIFLEAYFKYLHHPNEEKGVDFWWVDWQQGETSKLPGLDPLWVLNHYHYLDNQKEYKRPMILSRYAGPGSHRYPVGFSGDSVISWETLAFQPYFTATASNIGYGWWSHDIGGHMLGTYDEELQVRWMQWGVFSPINRMHSSASEFNHKEPWNYGHETCRIISKYLRVRHQLIPYLYTMNWLAHTEGEMLMQPMYYQYPEKEWAYHVPNQYYFGTEMICLPITAPIIKRLNMAKVKGWLPEGTYIDWQRGTIYHGNRELCFYRCLEEMPVLLKAGAIVVCAAQAENNAIGNPEAFEITVTAGANGKFTLYEDDGESFAYQQGAYVSTDFSLDYEEQGMFTIYASKGDTCLIPQTRKYQIHFLGFEKPMAAIAKVDGEERELQVEYCESKKEVTVYIEGSVTKDVSIQFAGGMQMAQNDVEQLCFDVLDRAHISYVVKETVHRKMRKGTTLEELKEYMADEELYGALAEVIYA